LRLPYRLSSPTLSTPRERQLLRLLCPTCCTHAGKTIDYGIECLADYPFYSILYKTKLPFIVVFNKTDVQPHDFAVEWMTDFEAFQRELAFNTGALDSEGEPTYMASLMTSMSLVLDEFYKNLKVRTSLSAAD